jgi:hypothetical protein
VRGLQEHARPAQARGRAARRPRVDQGRGRCLAGIGVFFVGCFSQEVWSGIRFDSCNGLKNKQAGARQGPPKKRAGRAQRAPAAAAGAA